MEKDLVIEKGKMYYIYDDNNFDGSATVIEIFEETCIVSWEYNNELRIVRKSAFVMQEGE